MGYVSATAGAILATGLRKERLTQYRVPGVRLGMRNRKSGFDRTAVAGESGNNYDKRNVDQFACKRHQSIKSVFTRLGFSFNEQRSNAELASLIIGEKHLAVNLFKDSTFETFTKNKVADANQATEVLLSIGAESREGVDEMLRKAVGAGGTIFSESQEKDGWMYGCGFADLDEHRWNALYMDMSRMPKQ